MDSTRGLLSSLRSLRERRKARRRPTGLQFAFADSIDALRPDHWDAVCAGQSLFLRREALRVVEESGPENLRPRYALAYDEGEPVAAVAAQIVELTGDRLRAVKTNAGEGRMRLLKRALKPAAAASERMRQRMLVAGNLMSWGFHGIAFRPGLDPSDLWPAIGEALYRIRRAARLEGQTQLVMVKDLTAAQGSLDGLHRLSYRPLETEPNMVLEIDPDWRSYEDYLQALDAKYRRNARDQLKKLASAGCVLEPLVDLEPDAARLHELYLAVHEKASVRLVTLPRDFLPELAKAAGRDFHCTVARQGGRIVGFVTHLRDGETAIAYYIGFDRELAGQGVPLYLRLLHSTIDQAIAWGCKRLSLGRTALEPKAAMGAKPEPMTAWMRHRVPALNWVLRGLINTVDHEEAPERNPFKTTKPE
ncbi:MAG: GNAT family N-acetyltransferase [Verrucomicrobia bacterium]|nr:GNAT family N-acetyltransferase [Verrucomicrobiota bacterium]MBI3871166.1 GNAT family N-acetyltransferase [Verrucomicrobiota bacterium]